MIIFSSSKYKLIYFLSFKNSRVTKVEVKNQVFVLHFRKCRAIPVNPPKRLLFVVWCGVNPGDLLFLPRRPETDPD